MDQFRAAIGNGDVVSQCLSLCLTGGVHAFLAFRQEPVSSAPELAKWVDGKIKSPQDGLIKAFGQGFVESPIRRAGQTERVAGWVQLTITLRGHMPGR